MDKLSCDIHPRKMIKMVRRVGTVFNVAGCLIRGRCRWSVTYTSPRGQLPNLSFWIEGHFRRGHTVSWQDETLFLLLSRPGQEPTTSHTPRLHITNKESHTLPVRHIYIYIQIMSTHTHVPKAYKLPLQHEISRIFQKVTDNHKQSFLSCRLKELQCWILKSSLPIKIKFIIQYMGYTILLYYVIHENTSSFKLPKFLATCVW